MLAFILPSCSCVCSQKSHAVREKVDFGGGILPGGENMIKKKGFQRESTEEDDLNIYSSDVRESMLDNDELSPMEDAFMNGYEDAI